MKLKKIAETIAALEIQYQRSNDSKEKSKIEEEIARISSTLSLEEMIELDVIIQKILEKIDF